MISYTKFVKTIALLLICGFVVASAGCVSEPQQQKSDSGVTKATVTVQTDPNGHTVEQNNIIKRYNGDNQVGSYKYLYVINAFTNDVVIFSTVKGKVTSSGKRFTPEPSPAAPTVKLESRQ